jgi:CubicO group peptidase (beta-lactamase class C family)
MRNTLGVLVLLCVAGASSSDPVAQSSAAWPPPRFADPARAEKLATAFPVIDSVFREYGNRMPGYAYGVIIDGRLAHSGFGGARDLASTTPVDADTVFRIASMTKSFTAIAVLRLRDEGKLSLDDPAERYVPELSNLRYPTAYSPRITAPRSKSWGFRLR